VTKQERFQQKQWGQIVARTWSDPEFKARFIAEPHVVLREFGIEPAAGMEIRVVQDEPGVQHLILPACPAEDLAEVELTPGAVGYCYCAYSYYCGRCGRCGCGCA